MATVIASEVTIELSLGDAQELRDFIRSKTMHTNRQDWPAMAELETELRNRLGD